MNHLEPNRRNNPPAAVQARVDLTRLDLSLLQRRLLRAADQLRHSSDFHSRPITQLAELAILCELRQQLGLPPDFT